MGSCLKCTYFCWPKHPYYSLSHIFTMGYFYAWMESVRSEDETPRPIKFILSLWYVLLERSGKNRAAFTAFLRFTWAERKKESSLFELWSAGWMWTWLAGWISSARGHWTDPGLWLHASFNASYWFVILHFISDWWDIELCDSLECFLFYVDCTLLDWIQGM